MSKVKLVEVQDISGTKLKRVSYTVGGEKSSITIREDVNPGEAVKANLARIEKRRLES